MRLEDRQLEKLASACDGTHEGIELHGLMLLEALLAHTNRGMPFIC